MPYELDRTVATARAAHAAGRASCDWAAWPRPGLPGQFLCCQRWVRRLVSICPHARAHLAVNFFFCFAIHTPPMAPHVVAPACLARSRRRTVSRKLRPERDTGGVRNHSVAKTQTAKCAHLAVNHARPCAAPEAGYTLLGVHWRTTACEFALLPLLALWGPLARVVQHNTVVHTTRLSREPQRTRASMSDIVWPTRSSA